MNCEARLTRHLITRRCQTLVRHLSCTGGFVPRLICLAGKLPVRLLYGADKSAVRSRYSAGMLAVRLARLVT
jgi:hypothetical protein